MNYKSIPARWQEALDFTMHACRTMGIASNSQFAQVLLVYLMPIPGHNPYLGADYALRLWEFPQSTEPTEPDPALSISAPPEVRPGPECKSNKPEDVPTPE